MGDFVTPERWLRISGILDRVLDVGPADRPRLLADLCGSDAGLRAEVDALLAADRDAGDLLDTPAGDYLEADGDFPDEGLGTLTTCSAAALVVVEATVRGSSSDALLKIARYAAERAPMAVEEGGQR